MNRTPARLLASGVLALSVAAGVTATSTSAASATSATVGASACNRQVKLNTDVSTTVKLRTGPGKKYLAKGQLSEGTRVYWACNKGSLGSAKSWGYLKVKSGPNKGKWGWVSRLYINTPMQTD